MVKVNCKICHSELAVVVHYGSELRKERKLSPWVEAAVEKSVVVRNQVVLSVSPCFSGSDGALSCFHPRMKRRSILSMHFTYPDT